MPVKPADELRTLVERLMRNAGASGANAKRVAEGLVSSNLAGHDSHGAQMALAYVNAVREGWIVPTAIPEIVRETPNTALVRGNWGFGHVTAKFGVEVALQKAREHDIAWVSLAEANHIGRVGEYAEMAVETGLAVMIAVGGGGEEAPIAVPYGGRKALIATNPIAFGFPAGDEPPVIVDFATTTIAGGKVLLARNKGERLPDGCIVDKDGNPSNDPNDYYAGGALQFGNHKSYALAVAVEFLGRLLGASDHYAIPERGGPMFQRGATFRHNGVSIIAFNHRHFEGEDSYRDRTDAYLRRVRSSPPSDGFAEVMAPGDPERRSRERRLREGIPIPDEIWDKLTELLESPASRPGVP